MLVKHSTLQYPADGSGMETLTFTVETGLMNLRA